MTPSSMNAKERRRRVREDILCGSNAEGFDASCVKHKWNIGPQHTREQLATVFTAHYVALHQDEQA